MKYQDAVRAPMQEIFDLMYLGMKSQGWRKSTDSWFPGCGKPACIGTWGRRDPLGYVLDRQLCLAVERSTNKRAWTLYEGDATHKDGLRLMQAAQEIHDTTTCRQGMRDCFKVLAAMYDLQVPA